LIFYKNYDKIYYNQKERIKKMYRYYILSSEDEEIYDESGVVTGKTYVEALANLASFYGEQNICKVHLEFISESPCVTDAEIKECSI